MRTTSRNWPVDQLTSFLEEHRAAQVKRLKAMRSFGSCWPIWERQIQEITSDYTDPKGIYDLGHHLSDIFRSTGGEGRDQSSLSGGGAAWEALVCWYLNLVFVGTRAIAFKQNKALVPRCIYDAATVTYGSHPTNTESDISVIVVPGGVQMPAVSTSGLDTYEALVRQDFSNVTLGIIQCKTNWNDNAQIPMLWDMVYRADYPKGTGVVIGRNGYSVRHLDFSYSFVVVPSQKSEIVAGSVPTIRVNALSGGNYWGQPTKRGVALGLPEIFMRNFGSAFEQNVQDTIKNAIHKKIGPYG
jgi:hypothetical protein